MEKFELDGDFIELFRLLKILDWASSGGDAKFSIDEGEVLVNNEVELRRRRKIRVGDIIQMNDKKAEVVSA